MRFALWALTLSALRACFLNINVKKNKREARLNVHSCQFDKLHVYTKTTVTSLAPCAPNTRACSMSAVLEGPEMKQAKGTSGRLGKRR